MDKHLNGRIINNLTCVDNIIYDQNDLNTPLLYYLKKPCLRIIMCIAIILNKIILIMILKSLAYISTVLSPPYWLV